MVAFGDMAVEDLKKMCTERSLAVTGSKAELIARLTAAEEKTAEKTGAVPTKKANSNCSEEEILKRRTAKFGVAPAPKHDLDNCSEVEKQKRRAERFDIFHPDLETEKARKRACRFSDGVDDSLTLSKLGDMRKRMERFGTEPTVSISSEDKMAARAKRFASQPEPTPSSKDDVFAEDKKKQRLARFGAELDVGAVLSEEKKQQRAERFGTASISDERMKKMRAERFSIPV